jgi:hypothetical protein
MQASRLDIVHERNNNKEPPSPKQWIKSAAPKTRTKFRVHTNAQFGQTRATSSHIRGPNNNNNQTATTFEESTKKSQAPPNRGIHNNTHRAPKDPPQSLNGHHTKDHHKSNATQPPTGQPSNGWGPEPYPN